MKIIPREICIPKKVMVQSNCVVPSRVERIPAIVVRTVTKYGMIEKLLGSWYGKDICLYSEGSRSTLGPIQPPIQRILRVFLLNWNGRAIKMNEYLHPSSARVNNNFINPYLHRGHRDKFFLFFFFFFFWHYSPWWTLTSSKIAVHCSRSCYLRFQLLMPILFRSSSTDSSHLNFGFPTRWVLSFLRTVSFLQGSSSCILK